MSRTLGKTLGTVTVRKLASKQPLGLEALLVTSVQHHINIPLDVYLGGVTIGCSAVHAANDPADTGAAGRAPCWPEPIRSSMSARSKVGSGR